MTHDDTREMLAALALDALSPEEREAARAHVAGCAECQRELAALENAAGALAYAVPYAPLDAARCNPMRERLVARAGAERGERAVRPAALPDADVSPLRRVETPVGRRRGVRWLARAAIVVVGVGLLAYALGERSRANRLAETLARVNLEQRALRASLDSNTRMIDQLVGPAVQVVELTSSGERRPSGRMFWDQASDAWTFVAHDLPPLPAGRTYQLWLIDAAEQRISAGTFAPGSNGDALVRAQYRLSPDSLRMVAVTEEPEGGVPQPTGSPVLTGSARAQSR